MVVGEMGSTRSPIRPQPGLVSLISQWRARAQELLAQADVMLDDEARLTMRQIAAKYEVLAQRIEQQVNRADK